MPKFMILYNSNVPASEVMANTSPEELKASMDEWLQWRNEALKTAKVEFGAPIQAVNRITSEGITSSSNPGSGYSIVEDESKEAVVEVLKTHPHMKRPGLSIDVFEILPMPGVEQ